MFFSARTMASLHVVTELLAGARRLCWRGRRTLQRSRRCEDTCRAAIKPIAQTSHFARAVAAQDGAVLNQRDLAAHARRGDRPSPCRHSRRQRPRDRTRLSRSAPRAGPASCRRHAGRIAPSFGGWTRGRRLNRIASQRPSKPVRSCRASRRLVRSESRPCRRHARTTRRPSCRTSPAAGLPSTSS